MKPAMHGESGYKRLANDQYMTPPWVTEALAKNIKLPPNIWEPAAGSGAMSRVLKEQGFDVIESDIDPSHQDILKRDFFSFNLASGIFPWDGIVTNPPYSCAQRFIEHALDLAKTDSGMVAMLLRNEYDCAKSRHHLFADHPAFVMKLVLTKRPRWFADDKAAPRHNFAWYIWNWSDAGYHWPAQIKWAK